MMNLGRFDYIIVGGGAAGCVLANKLSTDEKISVLLLEAGQDQKWIWTKIPMGYLYCINNPRTDWCYKTEPEPGLNNRSINYARGKGLGGCTLINGMLYMRGQARDYDEWSSLTQDSRWCWSNVLPHFKQVEDHWDGNSQNHNEGGEWRVEKQRLSWDILDRFSEAAWQAGIPQITDFNCGNNFGVSQFEVNQKKGLRWSTVNAFLDPVRHRSNLTIVTGALSDKLIMDGQKTLGINFIKHGIAHRAYANIETILTAGSIGSPAILQRSGIGNGKKLNTSGIPVHHHLPGVGENLQDHLQLRSIYKIKNAKTLNQKANSLFGKASMGLEYILFRKGPLTMAPSQLGLFAHSSPDEKTPDLEYHVQPLSLEKFGDVLHTFPAITASVCNLRPKSRGSIQISNLDPNSPPKIAPNYLSHEQDKIKAAQSLRLTRTIVSQKALRPFEPEEYLPGNQYDTDEKLISAAGDIGTTIFHPVGTCKMGRADDPNSVVDSQLRVLGVEALRIADASIMPTITSGNTSSPTIMIATAAADIIINDRKKKYGATL